MSTPHSPTSVAEDVGKRSSGPCGSDGMFSWCEVQMTMQNVCGNNGLREIDSRDDDNHNGTYPASRELGSDSCLEDKLKAFGEELEMTLSTTSFNTSTSAIQECKSNISKGYTLSRFNSSTPSMFGIDKPRFDHFMCMVDSASKKNGVQSVPVAEVYISMGAEFGRTFADTKSKELAVQLFEEAFMICQAKLGDSHDLTIECRVALGKVCLSLERYDEALDCFCMAVYMREALLGELHQSVSELWVLISSVHQATSKLELALKASAKALTGYRNTYGDKHATVIGVLKTIAQIHIGMGNGSKANDIHKYVRLHSP